MVRKVLLFVALAATAACVTGGKLRQSSAVVRADLEKARKSGAVRCAPKELALAEANVDFAEAEIASGNASRAQEHVAAAERNVRRALELSKTCGPTQVTIAKKAPEPKGIRIEKTDKDADGVPDLDDACPEQPGKPEFKGCPDGDGDGIPDSEDACPDQPGTKEAHGCPVAKDSDGDAIPDDIDRCPLDPEDVDGFQDEDGCPDADNDGDGMVDKVDACPDAAGPIENRGCPAVDRDQDGVPDADDRCPDAFGPPPDGCPRKYSLVEVQKEKIEIKQQVHFANAKFRVLPDSFPLLDQVVQALNDFPKLRVSIEGHTDNVGGEPNNLRLSQRRAEAVLDYLVSKGISPERLQAVGFGATKPVASNKTVKGKAKNRRTEFRIVAAE
jgi:outer membrane protein OmpA-like peptidoglycan-associated protein